jgi:hypothetical protein
MKWIGWDWDQYQTAPSDLTDRIIECIQEEHDRHQENLKKIQSSSTGKVAAPYRAERMNDGSVKIVREKEAKPEAAKVVDGKVTKVKEDGTTVTHRELTPGESIIHQMFGKPKSWQNK